MMMMLNTVAALALFAVASAFAPASVAFPRTLSSPSALFAQDILSTAASLQGPPIQWGSEGVMLGHEESDIKGYDNFSVFGKAVAAAGLTAALQGPGPFTVFLPIDSAFDGKVEALLANPTKLADILKYHIVPGSIANPSGDMVTAHGATLTYGRRFRKNFVDFAMMDPTYPTNVVCTNGIIHVIDSVLEPHTYNKISAEAGLGGVK